MGKVNALWQDELQKAHEEIEVLRVALELILPLAKGYAPKGQTNKAKATCRSWVETAEQALTHTAFE